MTPPGPAPGAGPRDLPRILFAVLVIGGLLAASLWVLRPFIGPGIWATMVVVSTWPLMRRLQHRLGNRRAPAVAVMTLALLLLVAVPLALAIVTVVDNADLMTGWARAAAVYEMPGRAPAWLAKLPIVGGLAERLWQQAAAFGVRDLLPRLGPYAGDVTRWFVAEVGSLGLLLLQFLLTLVIAAVLYASGEKAAAQVRRFARRLGGEHGVAAVELAAGAIRGVALGVGVTALVQAVMAGLGLALAGVPFAGLLTAVVLVLCIAQIGPIPVLLGAAGWALWSGATGWAVFLFVWGLIVGTLDNFLRPVLIKRGADLPLVLVFVGVVGGLIAFGLVGLFIGPVVLAVAWTLLQVWISGPPGGGEAGETDRGFTE